ncbi:acyl-CoA thioesterase [Telmatospirillum siberiense]|uniref:Acyl-CoA thioesterase n=1 Tax=Telmatospirillum siberiense TaxID=382514 RepID=A0A2N3PNR9_9PROT|nr:acyl-CoA thioesterase [Telmatospirillum siberiense]PKU22035.1 acyl-CoA thioesterase [Telmatospirillum siberiense]
MPRIFTHRFSVPEEAIDELGHVNNLKYLGWMQDVAIAHSSAQGWPLERYVEIGQSWVVKSHFIKYVRPAFAGETITLYTWIAGFSPRSSPRKYLFWRAADRQVLAEAETMWVFVDLKSGHPRHLPEPVRSAFEIVEDPGEILRLAHAEGHAGE